jgi:arylsulfatase A-like enzyme
MIIHDPRPQADATRGTTCDALVEAIDLAATFTACAGADVPDHILEGRDLTPWLHGQTPNWRAYAISEFDYSATPQAAKLALTPRDCRLFMVFDGRYKLMHAEGGLRPMLFDVHEDPDEFDDLVKTDPDHPALAKLYGHLHDWSRRMSQRVTMSDQDILAKRGKSLRKGVLPFLADGTEVPEDLMQKYIGPTRQKHGPR